MIMIDNWELALSREQEAANRRGGIFIETGKREKGKGIAAHMG